MHHLDKSQVFDVSGRVVLITGGGTGIGLMIATGFAANGAKVYIGSRRGEVVEDSAKQNNPDVKGKIIPLELDVSDKNSILAAVKTISENDGVLDVLVNNAAQMGPVSAFVTDPSAKENQSAEAFGKALFEGQKVQEWGDLYSTNVASIFFVTTAFLGLLNKASEKRGAWSATVINISSVNGSLKISQGKFAYNAVKAGNIHLTKSFATEFALKGFPIRVNSIAPGTYPSEMTGGQGQEFSGEQVSEMVAGLRPVPIGRGGTQVDMAGTAMYLASPASYYMTGQVVTIDGGILAVNPASSL